MACFYLLSLRLVPVFPLLSDQICVMGLTPMRALPYTLTSQNRHAAGTIVYVNSRHPAAAAAQASTESSRRRCWVGSALLGRLPLDRQAARCAAGSAASYARWPRPAAL